MTCKTHLAAGFAICCGLCIIAQPTPGIAFATIGASALCSVLPDIDTASSWIGCRFAPLAWILRVLFGHRQFFHSLLCWTVSAVTVWLCGAPLIAAIGVAAGSTSHLLLDMLNPSGVQLLWPKATRFSLAKLRCGGLIDHILALTFTVATIWLGYQYFTSLH